MSKFLIELPENDEIEDLVGLMASFAKAEYRIVQTLETDSEKLARAVTGLTGQILTLEDAFGGRQAAINKNGATALWSVDDAIDEQLHPSDVGKVAEENGVKHSSFLVDAVSRLKPELTQILDRSVKKQIARMEEDILKMPVVVTTAAVPGTILAVQNGKAVGGIVSLAEGEPAPSTDKTCKYCGDPVGPRAKICEKKECHSKRQKEWDAAWKAKKKAEKQAIVPTSVVEPVGTAEETPAESPFAGTSFKVLTGHYALMAIPAYALTRMIQNVTLPETTIVQDMSNGQLYAVQHGTLVKHEPAEVTPAAGPGAGETEPAKP